MMDKVKTTEKKDNSQSLHIKYNESTDPSSTYREGYIDALKQLHPELKLSYGYIGNYRTIGPKEGRDDTWHRIWCHSLFVRSWFIKIYEQHKYTRFNGLDGFWHHDMTFCLGPGPKTDEYFTEAIKSGSLSIWIQRMQAMHDRALRAWKYDPHWADNYIEEYLLVDPDLEEIVNKSETQRAKDLDTWIDGGHIKTINGWDSIKEERDKALKDGK